MVLTCVLSELFQARYVDEVRRRAGVGLSEADARGAGSSPPLAPRRQAPLDVGAHLAAVRPPVAEVVLPFPHGDHGLRGPRGPGPRRRRRRRAVSRAVDPGAGSRHDRHVHGEQRLVLASGSTDCSCDGEKGEKTTSQLKYSMVDVLTRL